MDASGARNQPAAIGWRYLLAAECGAVPMILAGCDPVVSIAGANFPDWLICVIAGAVIAASARPLLSLAGFERYLRPLMLFYSGLIVLIALLTWILFFNRT